MTVDYQVLFNGAVALAAFFGGWIINNIYKAVERLDKDVRDFPITYLGRLPRRHERGEEDARQDLRQARRESR